MSAVDDYLFRDAVPAQSVQHAVVMPVKRTSYLLAVVGGVLGGSVVIGAVYAVFSIVL